jgi:two-component system, NarL family, response regulator LiaR
MTDGIRRIRVLIVDDHEMVRGGLAAFLHSADDLELAGEAETGEEAVQLCASIQPDVVLMDVILPEMDGIAATRTIRQRHPRIQIIALTSFRDEHLVQGALEAGAISYILKNVGAEQLAAAIRLAAAGRSTLAPEIVQTLVQHASGPSPPGEDLSPREREVLVLLVEGLSNPAIASRLVVARSTVNFHVGNILTKLGAASRTEAVARAVQHHLVGRG